MKKILELCILAVGMIACTEQNTPVNPSSGGGTDSTSTVIPSDTTIATTDTIRITWNGASATIEGAHDGVSVADNNGYVNVVSTVKDITYILSGNGNGSLHIEGTNRHQLILSDLNLSCSDGPAINNQCHKKCYIVLEGTNTLTDGTTYASSTEDRKAAFFSEGQMIFSGGGILTVKGNYKHALASDDYIQFAQSTGSLNLTAASDGIHANDGLYFDGGTFSISAGSDGVQCDSNIIVNNGILTITAEADGIQSDTAGIFINGGAITITKAGDKGITAFGDITITDGTIRVTSQYKCLKAGKAESTSTGWQTKKTIISAGNITINGGDIQCICTGTSSSEGGPGGGGRPGDNSSSDSSTPEGIEAKGTITINGGKVYVQASDDAINSAGVMTINGGYVCAYSTSNDGLDANADLYINGGVVYAIGAGGAEKSIDALEGCTLYVKGGTLFCIGDLESGASLQQACYSVSSWNASTWYALTVGNETIVFKTPTNTSTSSGGHGPGGGGSNRTLVVSGASKPTLTSGVTVNGGTSIFNGMAVLNASVSSGSNVSLSSYTPSTQGLGGGGGWGL